MLKTLSIIIPNYNGEKLIPEFLPTALRAAAAYPAESEIIVVDDCSTDRSLAVLADHAGRFRPFQVIEKKENGGFSKTCNVGIRHARHQVLFFLNTDVALEEDYFSHFSRHFDDPQVFAVTTCGYRLGTRQQIDGIKAASWRKGFLRVTRNYLNDRISGRSLSPPYRSFSVQGAHFFADAEKVAKLGGFDELFSPFIFEETDLAYRALKRGWTIIYEPGCVSHHQVGASITSVTSRFRYRTIAARNRLIFTWKNIHSPRLFRSHLLFQAARLLSLNPVEWNATLQALRRLRAIRQGRQMERQTAVVTDEALLGLYEDYFRPLETDGH
jgi:GT2 family glycosyltransferase